MNKDSTYQSTCAEHNLPEDILIRPDRSKSEQKQVCRQCADKLYGIELVQSVKNQNKGFIEGFESQAKSNSTKMNQIIQSLISIRDMLNKKIERLIDELRNQIQNQDDFLKQCRNFILQEKAIKQLHKKQITNLMI